MKRMFVYILECSDSSFYTGVTNELEKRIRIHEAGINRDCYTFTRRPVKLVYYEEFPDPLSAIAFEKKVKGWRREKKMALIAHKYELLPELSVNYKKRAESSSTSSE
ncbi:MAG: GIY-YIG nuclease family protein [Bacteroidia bacterium]|jgi:putative endonuclease